MAATYDEREDNITQVWHLDNPVLNIPDVEASGDYSLNLLMEMLSQGLNYFEESTKVYR